MNEKLGSGLEQYFVKKRSKRDQKQGYFYINNGLGMLYKYYCFKQTLFLRNDDYT